MLSTLDFLFIKRIQSHGVVKIKSDNRSYLRFIFRFNTDHFFTQPSSPSGNPFNLDKISWHNLSPLSTLFKLPSSPAEFPSLLTGLCLPLPVHLCTPFSVTVVEVCVQILGVCQRKSCRLYSERKVHYLLWFPISSEYKPQLFLWPAKTPRSGLCNFFLLVFPFVFENTLSLFSVPLARQWCFCFRAFPANTCLTDDFPPQNLVNCSFYWFYPAAPNPPSI